jgi:predicted outer membrane repeat protein
MELRHPIAWAVLAALVLVSRAGADTIRVPADQPTIQAGIDAAAPDDTVLVAPGTYTGSGNKNIDFLGKDVVLRSEAGAEATVIDCQADVTQPARAIYFHSSETPAAQVEGFTIRNGYARDQGPNGRGGAVLADSASATFKSCQFIMNQAEFGGGAVNGTNGSLKLTDCLFRLNNSRFSGAIHADRCSIQLYGCTFDRNIVSYLSGAVTINVATAIIDGCTFVGNNTDFEGAALSCDGSEVSISQCTFYDNLAFNGSCVSIFTSQVQMSNTIIAFSARGSAVECNNPPPSLTCCDIFGNEGGDWVECIAGQVGTNGNISEDPLFCDAPQGDLRLDASSPCAPGQSPPGCGLIGAHQVGCGVADVASGGSTGVGRKLRAWPNPAPRGAPITFEPVADEGAGIAIYNAAGRIVSLLRPSLSRDLRWSPEERLAPGIYLARPQGRGHGEALKLVILP